ncbi:hypothetical protein [Loktanella sp. SALINAS62]|uniref:hypothetical protein n=1 Tax=Loktanella sp. SALINAS62 TaxID=2706124 RepID=UPI001B8A8F08|nr:hypothetical protein [Loktanella sp. SALINAS62]MBS1302040.1 hypothetical protein [Loktanella sp. SALINAS62]
MRLPFLTAALCLLPTILWAEVGLVMAEERGCIYCARWNADIANIYPKTPEGRAAPLMRYDIHDDEPPADLVSRVIFTPTFVLVQDGVEIDRLEGYPGEDFFWGLLGKMLSNANIPLHPEDDM